MTHYTQEHLDEAREAYRLRAQGQLAVSVKYDGREVSYNQVSLKDLRRHVADIEKALAGCATPRIRTFGTDRGFRG